MSQGVTVVGLYVRDQDEALAFYVERLGLRVHTDVRNGDYRWLTVQHPDQPSFQLGLFAPGPPVLDSATAQTLRGATLMFAGNIPGETQTLPTAIYIAIDSGNMTMAWAWVISIVIISFIMLLTIRVKHD